MPVPAAPLLALLLASQAPSAQPPSGENLLTGSVAAVDPSGGTVTLRPRNGPETVFKVSDKTVLLRARRAATLEQMQPGDEVVARFRKSAATPRPLYDLVDRRSWEWLQHMRKEIVQAELVTTADGWLHVAEGTEKLPFAYRVTAKTSWTRGELEASPEAFKPGDTVWIAPRLLPSGATMATAVADSAKWARILQERGRPTVTGSITEVNTSSRTLRMATRAGDDRTLLLAEGVEIRLNTKPEPLTSLKPGRRITAHVRRDSAGTQEVVRITIQPDAAAKRNPAAMPKAARKPAPKPS